MISHTTGRFRKAFKVLPVHIRGQARSAYRLFRKNPYHPGLRFKSIHPTEPIYSVRIGVNYRAVGIRDGDEISWFWIGSHAAYEKLISQM